MPRNWTPGTIAEPTKQQRLGDLRHLISLTNAQYLVTPEEDVPAWLRLRTSRLYKMAQSIWYMMEGICLPNCALYEFVNEKLLSVGILYPSIGLDRNAFDYCTHCIRRLLKCLKHFYDHHFADNVLVGPCLQELKIVYKIIYSFGMDKQLLDQGDVNEIQRLEDLRHLISQTDAQSLVYPITDPQASLWWHTSRFYEMVQSIRYIMEGICQPNICAMYEFVVEQAASVGKYLDKGMDPNANMNCPQCIIKLLKCLKHLYVHHFAGDVLVGPCLQQLKGVYKIIYRFAKGRSFMRIENVPELDILTKLIFGDETVA